MRIEDRHRQIVEQVRGAGRVLVTELAEHFDVTPETIRRDLAALDRSGVLRKVHGGAIPAPAPPETGVTQREQVNPTAKQAIARAALARLAPKPGTTLLIDAGTTTGSLARLLPGDTDLTVITNSVLTAAWLAAAYLPGVAIGFTGLPHWFEMACLLVPLLFILLCWAMVKLIFRDISLEDDDAV